MGLRMFDWLVAGLLASWCGVAAAFDDLVISEFMASNASTLVDEEDEYSDWIEIFNAGTARANLDGYFLTDDPQIAGKWRFPAVQLDPGSFLVLFASGKDRRSPSSTLHTNFKLDTAAGAYLGLIAPDGATAVFEYRDLPLQVVDYSYGLAMDATRASLIAAGDPARALVPAASTPSSWTQATFDDGAWASGPTGVGYDHNPDYLPLIGLDVRSAMDTVNTSIYIRVPFQISGPVNLSLLELRMKYDDGFVAYLNGSKIADRGAPASPAWNSGAAVARDENLAVVFEKISIPNAGPLLRSGANVLAIQGLNAGLTSSDLLIVPELDGFGAGTLDRVTKLYFHQPSPGSGNLPGYPGIAGVVNFSRPGGVFTGTIQLSLAADSIGSTIRYTTNGAVPDESSAGYSAPLSLAASTRIRARAFQAGLAPGPLLSESFVALAADAASFTSNLPVMVFENFGAGGVPAVDYQSAYWAVFEPGANGRTALNSAPTLQTRAGIKTRGSSTAGQAKPNLAVEARDERDADLDVSPLGMPAEADWVLYAPYNFDLALIRNALIFELSNRIGRYAVRTRQVEVFLHTASGTLARADYVGVYTFMEKIKRGKDRVDVERLTAADVDSPEVEGGYMFKIDRLDPGDSGFNAGGFTLGWVYPKEIHVIPEQKIWFSDYLNQMVASLSSKPLGVPDAGYAAYLDPPAWIDHHILNVLAMNVDALRLSAYYHKARTGKLEAGPIWDFDRSMGSTDGRDANPLAWNGTGDATLFFSYPWWVTLFNDVDFWQLWRDRWLELRRGEFDSANINDLIDQMADELRESQVRNFQRWNLLGGSTWQGAIDHLKNWLAQRSAWIDSQFPAAPSFSSPGGPLAPGFQLTITAPAGSILYTTDGSDPRLPGGGTSTRAKSYTGAVPISATSRVVARARRSASDWSGVTAATFYTSLPRLVVTEIHYHPADPPAGSPYDADSFEFLELKNVGSEAIVLAGFRIGGGIQFTFPPSDTAPLAPGAFVAVVKDAVAFAARYHAAGLRIAGEYQGRLNNAGDHVVLLGAMAEPILDFTYDPLWQPSTDGLGRSLVFIDPAAAPAAAWGDPAHWRASAVAGGTPGAEDPGDDPLGGRQLQGDANQDGGLDISDAMAILLDLFAGSGRPLPCDGAAFDAGSNLDLLDLNGDGKLNLSDALQLLGFLYRNGPAPVLGSWCTRILGCPDVCGL